MQDLISGSYQCAYCGEENEISVDPSGGPRQSYTEDCSVCCRPNVIHITISGGENISIRAEQEG
ncbi:MAG TPA: CPXCG motif-containing cysteine-rich protein [Bacteroidota bacterium]